MDAPKFDYLLREYGSMKNITEERVAGQTRYRMKDVKGRISKERLYGVLLAIHKEIEESRCIGEEKKLQALEDAFGPDGLVDPIALGMPLS